jgi:chaperonin cofactor prefoldin
LQLAAHCCGEPTADCVSARLQSLAMAGKRRIDRKVRVVLALSLVSTGLIVALAAVIAGVWVPAAAVVAAVLGIAAVQLMRTELIVLRTAWSRDRALQAKAHNAELARVHADSAVYRKVMTKTVKRRDRKIKELDGTIRLAEVRATEASTRARRSDLRAEELQERFTELLDDLLTRDPETAAEFKAKSEVDGDADHGIPAWEAALEQEDIPTIVDLLAWEDKNNRDLMDRIKKATRKQA